MLISWETSRCRKGGGEGEVKGQERDVVHLRTICKQAPHSSGNNSALGGSPGPYALRIGKDGRIFPLISTHFYSNKIEAESLRPLSL